MALFEVRVDCHDELPCRIFWEDGRSWNITRVLHSCKSETDFEGIRYTVKIGSAVKYIYRIRDRWYVDRLP